jgi:hypothetical protein
MTISVPTVDNLTVSGARVNWTSSIVADSLVRYGTTATYGSVSSAAAMVTTHAVVLTSLIEGTTYHYQVCSTDATNYQVCSADATFVTSDATPPTITGATCTPADNSLAIAWTTDEAATSFVDWDVTSGPPFANAAGTATPLATAHSVTVSGLTSGTNYYYRARSADATGNERIETTAICRTTRPVPAECSAACSTISYDLYIVNPDLTERHINTPWVQAQDLGGGNVIYNFEDKSITPGDPVFDYNDVRLQVNFADCQAIKIKVLANDGSWTHAVRLKVKIGGVEKSDTLIESDAKAAVGISLTLDAHALLSPDCPLPPAITNVVVAGITRNGATITWTTNKIATTWTDLGTVVGPPYAQSVGTDAPLALTHSVTLTGLTEGTLYDFRLRSKDSANREAATGNLTFTTAETVPPVITNVQAVDLDATTARLTWTTDESSDSTVLYGLTTAYGSTATSATMLTAHGLNLTGLEPNTTYSYTVQSRDKWGNLGTTTSYTFKTSKPAVPVISNVRAEFITEESARILWDTTTPTDSKVDYGVTTGYGSVKTLSPLTTSHSALITGLAQNTTYNYKVSGVDGYAQAATSANFTFKTLADAAAPGNVTGLSATGGDRLITLNWTNPGDLDLAGVRLVRSTTAFPASPTDGLTVHTGTGSTFEDTNVSNNIQYYYTAFAFDEVPNYASGAVASATPHGAADTTAPGNVTELTAVAGDARVQLSWTNPADADLVGTRLVRKENTCPTDPTDGVIVYDGLETSRLDTSVANGVTYCYVAYSRDSVPNWSSGVTATATPTAPHDTTPPAPVTNVTVSPGDTLLILVWTNPTDPDRAGTRVVRKLDSHPTGPDDGTTVYDGLANSFTDSGLANQTTYYYALYAYDAAGNLATPVKVSGTPDKDSSGVGPACLDSDGGLNYEIKGAVTLSDGTVSEDSCSDGQVKEFYCDVSNNSNYEMHGCGQGFKCSDGHCVTDAYVPTESQCGNGTCEGVENTLNCPVDCPVTPEAPPVQVKPTTVPEMRRLHVEDLLFFATTADIPLRVRYLYETAAGLSSNPINVILSPQAASAQTFATTGEIQVYNRMAFTVVLPRDHWVSTPETAYVNFAGTSYTMKLTARGYEAVVVSDNALGVNPLTIIINYPDKTNEYLPVTIRGVARPVVSGDVKDEADRPLQDVRVSLYVKTSGGSFGLWNVGASGQANPQMTDDNGRYSFVVPAGDYYLAAEKETYYTKETLRFHIDLENVITTNLQLRQLPPKVADVVSAIASGDVGKAVSDVGKQAEFVAQVVADAVIAAATNANVQEQAKSLAPAVTAIAVANIVTAAAALPYLNFLFSLLAHPLLLIARRRRKRWGIVYDALNKLPIDLAIVRLVDEKTNRIIRSAVTDKDGRYFFIVEAGEYRLVAVKPGYVFPTVFLRSAKEDAAYIDLYHGEKILVTAETSITANIPLDPVKAEKAPLRVMLEGVGRRLQKGLGLVTLLIMVVVFALNPTIIMGGVLAANFLFYALFNRLAMPRKPKSWGVVYDEQTEKPLSNVVVRIFESKYNKLLETQVTDIRGRYAFLVGSNVYYVTYEKPGYQKHQKGPVDFAYKEAVSVKKQEAKVVAVDIRLKPAEKGTGPTPEIATVPPPTPPTPPAVPPTPPVAPTAAPAASNRMAELEFIRNLAKKLVKPATPPPSLLEDVGHAHPEVLGLPKGNDEKK